MGYPGSSKSAWKREGTALAVFMGRLSTSRSILDNWRWAARLKDSQHWVKREGGKEKCKPWNNYVLELCFLCNYGTKMQPISERRLDCVNMFTSTFLYWNWRCLTMLLWNSYSPAYILVLHTACICIHAKDCLYPHTGHGFVYILHNYWNALTKNLTLSLPVPLPVVQTHIHTHTEIQPLKQL